MASLQNSLNNVDGLGTYSLSVLYGSLVVSSMFLPTFLIQKFTVKWTVILHYIFSQVAILWVHKILSKSNQRLVTAFLCSFWVLGVHRGPILCRVLHTHPGRSGRGDLCCAVVVGKVHIPHSPGSPVRRVGPRQFPSHHCPVLWRVFPIFPICLRLGTVNLVSRAEPRHQELHERCLHHVWRQVLPRHRVL